MSRIVRSYLAYTRGETPFSPWGLLYPLQFATRAWMRLRVSLYERGLFHTMEPKLPVVSIGNNSLGGTNKTPMCEYIVRQFHEAGINAGLVSRGYKTKEHEPLWIGQDEHSLHRETAGDEPLMLAKRLPNVKVVVSKDRVRGVALLASLGAEVAVTDDTFQHRRMARDVDIVLVDGTCPFGNGRVIPAGLMREPKSAFKRADIIIITKANQTPRDKIESTRRELERYVLPEKIFIAEMHPESWLVIGDREPQTVQINEKPQGSYIVFSAIGNPDGFYKYIEDRGIKVAAYRTYQDHHVFTQEDIVKLQLLAGELGASGFICTEKDTMNLPEGLRTHLPIYVLRIAISMAESMRMRRMIAEKLEPHLLVASNGYGEDAIGVMLAKKMSERFKSADISAFAFVGSGTHYTKEGINVVSPASEMPSGGVIKYSVSELVNDFRHGLGGSIKKQMDALRKIGGRYRTPVCVGDVYLFANMLWGQGISPVLLATAKSVRLSGHLPIERYLLKKRSRRVWTRDAETAEELRADGVDAEFSGNPVMDLIDDSGGEVFKWEDNGAAKVVLLPGSRPRAYEDVKLILDAASELSKRVKCNFVMIPAPTIDIKRMIDKLDGWNFSDSKHELVSGNVSVAIYRRGHVTAAARGADLLIGLGGTANQLCAGLGVPVVSIIEEGKLRQKKLLRDAEILVKANSFDLAEAAERVLSDPELWKKMSEAGIRCLGGQGALDRVVEYCADELGWDNRCKVYEKYKNYLDSIDRIKSDNK
jgi:tetraacyldisaccharide 4'-kinase